MISMPFVRNDVFARPIQNDIRASYCERYRKPCHPCVPREVFFPSSTPRRDLFDRPRTADTHGNLLKGLKFLTLPLRIKAFIQRSFLN
jgi:hypothetical protein